MFIKCVKKYSVKTDERITLRPFRDFLISFLFFLFCFALSSRRITDIRGAENGTVRMRFEVNVCVCLFVCLFPIDIPQRGTEKKPLAPRVPMIFENIYPILVYCTYV